jgi:xanthine dehydrogenase accessory factor
MFDLAALQQAITQHGRVARIVVAAVEGSAPREVGTAMLVWSAGQSGTIGGGALEWKAIQRARALLGTGGQDLTRQALGPNLNQCCGGAVTLLTETYDAAPTGPIIARATAGQPMPLAVSRLLATARNMGHQPTARLIQGWMIEPVTAAREPLWIWGAGHVGRALVDVLSPLPDFSLTWVDIAPDRFPPNPKAQVLALPDPAEAVALAPPNARHLIVTFSHSLDLELCHRLLGRGFTKCGLIGSTTKWARFRSRLAALGHTQDQIARILCPIGDPALGKHPQAIAIGVAAQILAGKNHVLQDARPSGTYDSGINSDY